MAKKKLEFTELSKEEVNVETTMETKDEVVVKEEPKVEHNGKSFLTASGNLRTDN